MTQNTLQWKLVIKKNKLPGHENLRILLLILGGGMQGVYGAGQVAAFHTLGFDSVFDTVAGLSTGSGIGAYFLAGMEQTLLGSSLYYEDCTTPEFLNLLRKRRKMDIAYLIAQMEEGKKKLNIPAIINGRPGFYVGLTTQAGDLHFVNAKKADPSLLQALHASMAIPGLYGEKVMVNRQEYIDGAINPFPIKETLERFAPTDIVVLPNKPRSIMDRDSLSRVENFVWRMLLRNCEPIIKEKALNIRTNFQDGVRLIEKQYPNVHILWPPDMGIDQLTTDPKKLKRAVVESANATLRMFDKENEKIPFI